MDGSARPTELLADQPRYDLGYLDNGTYDTYMRLPKGFVAEARVPELLDIGAELSANHDAQYLDVAGWAFAEAGLIAESTSSKERMAWLNEAERLWRSALEIATDAAGTLDPEVHYEDASAERLALNLAFLPSMKSIPAGGVLESVQRDVMRGVLGVAELSALRAELAVKEGHMAVSGVHLGLLHECNALLALLHLNDPRYVPLPSSARADSGYYLRDQSHDITVLNQHWGTIRKVIPIEIKASASRSDRMRYNALIVRGKMHLSVMGKHHPRNTLEAFSNIFNGEGGVEDSRIVDHATSSIKSLLVQYQQGETLGTKDSALTRFYVSGKRAAELTRYSRDAAA